MGYWIVELSNGRPALITDDPSITLESVLGGSEPECDNREREGIFNHILSEKSNHLFGEWSDFFAG